nr:MAG TPA: P63C domain protein [Caudoviricetes sp.]
MSKTQSVTGRAIGGKVRAEKMTPEQRKEQAAKMVAARQAKAAMPKAMYEGKLNIGNTELDVAVLDDNRRVITQAAIFRALDRPARGNARVIDTPVFIDAKNLQPFIDEDLRAVINKIEYVNLSNKKQEGFNATILPLVCDLYLKAREAGVITKANQLSTAQKAEILVRSLAKVGIIALVDEATGYQDVRAKDALAKILEAFVAKELQPWVKTFPLEYYKELCRLYNVPFPPLKNNKFPQFFGHITNNAVYTRLAPELLPELKKAASKQEKKAKLHQLLTQDVGHPKLKEHLASVVTLLKLAKDKDDFSRMLDIVHPKLNNTIPLDLGE